MLEPGSSHPRLKALHETATVLYEQTGAVKEVTLQQYVHRLCYCPIRLMSRGSFVLLGKDKPRYLLSAAIIMDCPTVVEKMLTSPDTPREILNDCRFGDLFSCAPVELAGRNGNLQILDLLLSTTRYRAKDEMREDALIGAVYGGHMEAVKLIFDERWGPINFISSPHCVEEPLINGMINSEHVDFSSRLYEFIESRSTIYYPIDVGTEPHPNDLLHHICANSCQRVDVAEHLLNRGATVQDIEIPPVNRTPAKYQGQASGPRQPYNPLRRAVLSGHEKIVRLLLEQGADPLATDDDVLWHAAALGRLDIVKMLVEYGADVNRIPEPPIFDRKQVWEAPVVMAIMTENEALCRYLIEQGAELNTTQSGGEALHRAADAGLDSMVRLLGEYGLQTDKPAIDAARMRGEKLMRQIMDNRMRRWGFKGRQLGEKETR